MNILAKVYAGSTLYGTAVEGSDTDFRSIYKPDIKDCILQTVSRAKEIEDEEDTTVFSLQYYLKMLASGQGVAIEMLCAPDSMIIIDSEVFKNIRKNRKLFFTKRMGSLLAFSRNMVSKYSLRIERLQAVENLIKIIDDCIKMGHYKNPKLDCIWNLLPETEFGIKTINERNTNGKNRVYEICGRQIQETTPLITVFGTLKTLKDSYGKRVKTSEENQYDYKSICHAFRALYQVREILETNDLIFPLKNADWLRDVRLGKYHFINDGLQIKLDELLAETEELVKKSSLPEKIDEEIANNIILSAYGY